MHVALWSTLVSVSLLGCAASGDGPSKTDDTKSDDQSASWNGYFHVTRWQEACAPADGCSGVTLRRVHGGPTPCFGGAEMKDGCMVRMDALDWSMTYHDDEFIKSQLGLIALDGKPESGRAFLVRGVFDDAENPATSTFAITEWWMGDGKPGTGTFAKLEQELDTPNVGPFHMFELNAERDLILADFDYSYLGMDEHEAVSGELELDGVIAAGTLQAKTFVANAVYFHLTPFD